MVEDLAKSTAAVRQPRLGRISRKTYLVYTLPYLAAYTGLKMAIPTNLWDVLLPPLFLVWVAVRRLHDIGRSGWWALVPFLMGFASGFVAVFERHADGLAAGQRGPISMGAVGLSVLATLVLLVWLAVKKGDGGPNRFGEGPSPY